jgi:hypothetical protein
MAIKRLSNGEHPAWMWLAFLLATFIFILHGSWSRTESFSIPGIGNAGVNASVGGQKGVAST